MEKFNPYVRSIVVRVSEARDQGDTASFDRYAFYEHMKIIAAAPPETLLCDEKNVKPYDVVNVTLPIVTTNHPMESLYIPPDDRRILAAISKAKKEEFTEDYWDRFYHWYEHEGGIGNVIAYLKELDLTIARIKLPRLPRQ
jgi:hypothetical protein